MADQEVEDALAHSFLAGAAAGADGRATGRGGARRLPRRRDRVPGRVAAHVSTAIMSHLHQDHIGGLPELTGSDLMVTGAEWAALSLRCDSSSPAWSCCPPTTPPPPGGCWTADTGRLRWRPLSNGNDMPAGDGRPASQNMTWALGLA